jgi:hypothetical protein
MAMLGGCLHPLLRAFVSINLVLQRAGWIT